MRSAPPLQVGVVNRYGVWPAIVSVLTVCACAAMVAWWCAHPLPVPRVVSVGASVGALAALASGIALWRVPPLTLRWDRQRWRVATHMPGQPATERAGDLAVAVDLGSWMLLRFVPESTGAAAWCFRRPMWIAVQRAGLEAQWHALRCALYAARTALPPGDVTRLETPCA
jgi:hypothetical protein